MDLFEAFVLLGIETLVDTDYDNYTNKDIEKCFRQQALKHHPDKGGDASYFQQLQRAKDILLEHIAENTSGSGMSFSKVNDANSTAVSTSLFSHRTCIRQVIALHGKYETVIAATDDGLVVIEWKKNAKDCLLGSREKLFKTHCADSSFLCCTVCDSSSDDIVFAGGKDGTLHRLDLSANEIIVSWRHPNRKRIVALSTVRDWVAMAIASEEIYILEFVNGKSMATVVWKLRVGSGILCKNGFNLSPECILLEEYQASQYLNLWVGGTDTTSTKGKLMMWELDIEDDLYERCCTDDIMMDDPLGDYNSDEISESSTETDLNEDRDGIPVIIAKIEEGPIYSLAKHERTIAVASGQNILVWDYITNHGSLQGGKKLIKQKTIQTNNQTLYALCINARFIAAAGSGEVIMVWDRDLWTLSHYLPSERHPSSCCLATNCIVTLDWFHEDSGVLISGGYDGAVTLWTLAIRLESR